MQRQGMRLELTPKLTEALSNITPDSGIDIEKIAKSLAKKFGSRSKLMQYLSEKFSIITGKSRSRLTQLDIISRDPVLRSNLLFEIDILITWNSLARHKAS